MNRRFLSLMALFPFVANLNAESVQSAQADAVSVTADRERVRVTFEEAPALSYILKKPTDSACSSPSAGYFHPLTTPSGWVVTDVASDDHRHHRGVFLAWIEVRGPAGEGDFWGWGAHAPGADRQIVHHDTDHVAATRNTATFTVRNDWLAASIPLLEETLRANVSFRPDARIHDLAYRLKPQDEVTLGQHAFSGFSVRLRKDAPLTACMIPPAKSPCRPPRT